MKDVVSVTKGLFDMSKETAKLEHEAFTLRQKVTLASEIKATLDSWVRFEAQAREAEQKELVNSVIGKVLKDLEDSKTQKDILAQAVADIECWSCLDTGVALLLSFVPPYSNGQGQEALNICPFKRWDEVS